RDIHARRRHPPGQLAELSGHALLEALHDDFAARRHVESGVVERSPRSIAVAKQEVRDAPAADRPRAAALDADSRRAERAAHRSERTRLGVEMDVEVEHRHASWPSCARLLSAGTASRRSWV